MNEDIMVDSTFLIETIVEKLKLLKSSLEKYGDSLEDKVKEIEMTINLGESILDDSKYFKEIDDLWEENAKEFGPEWPLVNKAKFAEWSSKHSAAEREYKKSIKTFYTLLANYSYDWWL